MFVAHAKKCPGTREFKDNADMEEKAETLSSSISSSPEWSGPTREPADVLSSRAQYVLSCQLTSIINCVHFPFAGANTTSSSE